MCCYLTQKKFYFIFSTYNSEILALLISKGIIPGYYTSKFLTMKISMNIKLLSLTVRSTKLIIKQTFLDRWD